jgi:serine/threonine protein phosphatase PrpC
MEVAVTTDVGTGQRFNDDAWCHEQLHRNVTLLAVADGFGRPQGISSAAIVLDAVREVIRRELRRATFPPRSLTSNDIRELLSAAFAHGNERLLHIGGGTDDYVAAGSTCTLVLIVSNQAFVAHIGDTRAYLIRRGELVQFTSDESLLPQRVRSASGQPGGARQLQMPALLTRALGVEPSTIVPPKIAHYSLLPHDAILLCTDGVSRAVGFAEMQGALAMRDSARVAAERIVAVARDAGSTDNATVILVRDATIHGPPVDGNPQLRAAPLRWAAAFAAAIALFAVTGITIRAYWFGDSNLYLAADGAGDVGLFAGSPGSLFGVPLHIERTEFQLATSQLSAADQRTIDAGVIPVATSDAANAIVARWQARSRQ